MELSPAIESKTLCYSRERWGHEEDSAGAQRRCRIDHFRRRNPRAGAIVGGAIASQHGYYGPGYYAPGYYGGGPAYVVDPGYGESCIWQRQRFWDGYGWRVRNVRVCD
jgi:hypothetical protein